MVLVYVARLYADAAARHYERWLLTLNLLSALLKSLLSIRTGKLQHPYSVIKVNFKGSRRWLECFPSRENVTRCIKPSSLKKKKNNPVILISCLTLACAHQPTHAALSATIPQTIYQLLSERHAVLWTVLPHRRMSSLSLTTITGDRRMLMKLVQTNPFHSLCASLEPDAHSP